MLRRFARRVAAHAKSLVGWLLFRTHFYRVLWRRRAIIVVFHRVNDLYPDDPLTLSSGDFERFSRFFSRFFEVIPLRELLRRLNHGGKLALALTITFDDGYRGNATIAAPVLERHGLRGCFFITTNYIATNFVPWWDEQQHIKTEWMEWDHVRGLRDAGHEIGSHTETHVDLGVVSPEEARREIRGGEDRIAAELGRSSGFFAYPFGGRRNISAENQELVRQLNLSCCLSAYGGVVAPGDDPFRLKRVNISGWFISPYQFGFEMLAGRLEQD
jgi:peptidoglycan/xylan/chitin deacetylase (PgdA/CDA1 family)